MCWLSPKTRKLASICLTAVRRCPLVRLTFSCLLMLYPPEAVECVVVHELAHIRHHDHSAAFYDFIYRVMPDYRRREALLKQPPEII